MVLLADLTQIGSDKRNRKKAFAISGKNGRSTIFLFFPCTSKPGKGEGWHISRNEAGRGREIFYDNDWKVLPRERARKVRGFGREGEKKVAIKSLTNPQ